MGGRARWSDGQGGDMLVSATITYYSIPKFHVLFYS
jgi:hypothetical protein